MSINVRCRLRFILRFYLHIADSVVPEFVRFMSYSVAWSEFSGLLKLRSVLEALASESEFDILS